MAETVRTWAEMLSDLADNNTGNITPQDMRNIITSLSQYGAIGKSPSDPLGSGQTLSTAFSNITQWTTNGSSTESVTPDFTQGRLTIDVDAAFIVFLYISFRGTNNNNYFGRVFKNGLDANIGAWEGRIVEANDTVIATVITGIDLVANDYIDYRVAAASGTPNFTLVNGGLGLLRIR